MEPHHRLAYCMSCGGRLEWRAAFGRRRPVCTECGRVHFQDPKVAAAAFVVQESKLLLVRRVNAPELGKWSLPAGYVDGDEDPKKAAEREVLEETGLDIETTSLLDVVHQAVEGEGASIVIVYRGELKGGKLQAGDDVDASGFFALNELPPLAFQSTLRMVDLWRKNKSGML
jgi:ADP-ribose pyrophosphatase YjhB (NUDIX family)